MDNSTDTSASSGPAPADTGNIVAITALIISLVALTLTILQVLQQYYASATGYANCSARVIGKWSNHTKRVPRPFEFRFEVQYDAPVIFVCRRSNQEGPVTGLPPLFIDGTPTSLAKTRSELELDGKEQQLGNSGKAQQKPKSAKERIHTADNELATWYTLLSLAQAMELKSREWQEEQYRTRPPRQGQMLQPLDFTQHTLAIAVQSKRKSWDTMPSSIKKPYATSTICHVVEMTAMLGLHWVEFDRTRDCYRAEGNGYILSGSKFPDLGIVLTFQKCGKSRFEANRMIPSHWVKEFCFGFVPTIYRSTKDERRLQSPTQDLKALSTIQLGSPTEIAETLFLLGCNIDTVNSVLDGRRQSHVFPVVFEILGMLGRIIHIDGSCYRTLPNPTMYTWDRNAFSMRRMLDAFETRIKDNEIPRTVVIQQMCDHIAKVKERLPQPEESVRSGGWLDISFLKALHDALDDLDEILTAKPKQEARELERRVAEASAAQRDDQEMSKTPEQPHERARREMVLEVLQIHFQEVFNMINEQYAGGMPTYTKGKDVADRFDQNHGFGKRLLDPVHQAVPAARQENLMEVYFEKIHPKVVGLGEEQQQQPGVESVAAQPRQGDIWCTLVFRMICWLMLHDFHKKDVQIPDSRKSELLGSRLPVYIL